MKLTFCDHCGKTVEDDPYKRCPGSVVFVQYIDDDGTIKSRHVDLCIECSRDLQENFLDEQAASNRVRGNS